jgi:hypothetical protein
VPDDERASHAVSGAGGTRTWAGTGNGRSHDSYRRPGSSRLAAGRPPAAGRGLTPLFRLPGDLNLIAVAVLYCVLAAVAIASLAAGLRIRWWARLLVAATSTLLIADSAFFDVFGGPFREPASLVGLLVAAALAVLAGGYWARDHTGPYGQRLHHIQAVDMIFTDIVTRQSAAPVQLRALGLPVVVFTWLFRHLPPALGLWLPMTALAVVALVAFVPPAYFAGISTTRHMVGMNLATVLALIVSVPLAASLIQQAWSGRRGRRPGSVLAAVAAQHPVGPSPRR